MNARESSYEDRYGSHADAFRRMDRQIKEAWLAVGRMRQAVKRMERINCALKGN